MTPEEVKAAFRQRGETFTDWAKEHGYRLNHVYRILNGIEKGTRGKGHEIAVKLGLKPQPNKQAA